MCPAKAGASSVEMSAEECFGRCQGTWADSILPTCPAGQEPVFDGTQECRTCPVGKYKAGSNTMACLGCDSGSFQFRSGESSCQACSIGEYQPQAGMATCQLCRGRLSSGAGATGCDVCDVNFVRDSAAKAASTDACKVCPFGARCD